MREPSRVNPELKAIVKQKLGIVCNGDFNKSITISEAHLLEMLSDAFVKGTESQNGTLNPEQLKTNLFFNQLMELLPDYVYFKDMKSRFLYVNPAQARHLGLDNPDEAIGKSDFDFFKPEFAYQKYQDEQKIIETGNGWIFFEEFHRQFDDQQRRWALTSKLPLHDENGEIIGTFGLSHDITDKKLAEMELERQKNLLETIIQILPCRVFVRDVEGKFVLINEEYREILNAETRKETIGKKFTDFITGEKAEKVLEEDRRIISTGEALRNQIEKDISPNKEHCWVLSSKVPLYSNRGDIEGVVGVVLDITEQKRAENEARRAHSALLEKNSQMEAELLLARQLQERLMAEGFNTGSRFQAIGQRWSVKANYWYQPGHHLAGDFFFLLPFHENRVGVIICDVMGHGVKAAMVTMLIRGLMLEIPDILGEPEKVLEFLNEKLIPLAEDPNFPRFITALYAVIDTEAGRIKMASAGHPVPLWMEEQNGNRDLKRFPMGLSGPALGLLPGMTYESAKLDLSLPTHLFFYTDGLVEAENDDGIAFGIEGVIDAMSHLGCCQPEEEIMGLSVALKSFTGHDAFDDDVCAVCLRIEK